MRGIATPTKAELQEVADRIASRFDYSQPISKSMLIQVAQEATAEVGLECEARFEGSTLKILLKAEPNIGVVPVTVVAASPTGHRGFRIHHG
jgi:hypothetical protein